MFVKDLKTQTQTQMENTSLENKKFLVIKHNDNLYLQGDFSYDHQQTEWFNMTYEMKHGEVYSEYGLDPKEYPTKDELKGVIQFLRGKHFNEKFLPSLDQPTSDDKQWGEQFEQFGQKFNVGSNIMSNICLTRKIGNMTVEINSTVMIGMDSKNKLTILDIPDIEIEKLTIIDLNIMDDQTVINKYLDMMKELGKNLKKEIEDDVEKFFRSIPVEYFFGDLIKYINPDIFSEIN
jgi:hypothetical protein